MAVLVCWKCGGSLKELTLPLSRRDDCPHCAAELHVCRLCRHYAPTLIGLCRHDYADPPRDKDRANFCDYFKPQANAYQKPVQSKSDLSRSALSELFGEPVPKSQNAENSDDPFAASEAARKKLQALFDDDKQEDEIN
jgi:hypothetical protein